ncbi:MAG: branched-chain amino acid ABC transporter permease [Bacillota bacterium]|nr:MAG: branched-chain amino acid ABC transporter permease [Bacillota bacterium]
MEFLASIINGLSLGAMYAMIALGYTMVYGIAKMLNFAHGDVITFGAYSVIIVSTSEVMPLLNLPIWVGFLAAVLVCAILGVVVEKIAYKPLRSASSLSVLITAIGVSYFLQNFFQIMFGTDNKDFPSIPLFNSIWHIGSFSVNVGSLFTLLFSVVIMIALTLFVKKTQTGRAMLAVSEDKSAAQLMGVNVNKTISITFAIGSALAAVAGFCYGYTRISISPISGAMPGIKAFVAAVLGGIGSIPGAFVGGLVLGLVEFLSKVYISTQWADVIVFGILILVLLVKPTGLLGKKRNEKV